MQKVERTFESEMTNVLEHLEAELSLVSQKQQQMERLHKSEGYDFAFIQSQALQGEMTAYKNAISQIKTAMIHMKGECKIEESNQNHINRHR